ncbi:MAG: hypothetical protein IJS19_09510 [Muribaculaceae bacterium]|nr:hypothetical protein [Muribaculaceae bacterium]
MVEEKRPELMVAASKKHYLAQSDKKGKITPYYRGYYLAQSFILANLSSLTNIIR